MPGSGDSHADGARHRHRGRGKTEIPLKLDQLSEAGAFALAQQWPKEGIWVIELVGRQGEMVTNTLVAAGPNGIDRFHAKSNLKRFAAADVEAMLQR